MTLQIRPALAGNYESYREASRAIDSLMSGTATATSALTAWYACRTSNASLGLPKGWLDEALNHIEHRQRRVFEPGLFEVVDSPTIGNYLTSRWYAGMDPFEAAEATCVWAAKNTLDALSRI